MLPVIALAGRPNVGKSTLFNRLTRSRDALVASMPGLTRDRQYGRGRIGDFPFIVVDTGGLSGELEGVEGNMADQAMLAVREADLVIFMVDAKAGRTGGDEIIAQEFREAGIPTILVANKIDGQNPDFANSEFHPLGLGQPDLISATHGNGVLRLLSERIAPLLEASELPAEENPLASEASSLRLNQEDSHEDDSQQDDSQQDDGDESDDRAEREGRPDVAGVKIAVVGRPNVGKSTLVNRLLGEDRVVVFDKAGTTRDSIYIPYEREGARYTLIDTAGVRKRGKVAEHVEKFSVIKTLEAITDANVVVLLVDARDGLVEQDMHLLGHVIDEGRALVLAVNKWDGLPREQRDSIRSELDRRLRFLDFAKMHFISALHGSGLGGLYKSIDEAYQSATTELPTRVLNEILQAALLGHQPPLVRGRRIKLRYAHGGGSNPPTIVIHGNQTEEVPETYQRYLEHRFVSALGLEGTPVRLLFRTGDNPFKGRRNPLSKRQVARKRRLMAHVTKAKKQDKRRRKR